MKKNNVSEIKEIKTIAESLLNKESITQEDIKKLSEKIDTALAQFGLFKKYFKRLV